MLGRSWDLFPFSLLVPPELRDHMFQRASGTEWLESGFSSETKSKVMEDAITPESGKACFCCHLDFLVQIEEWLQLNIIYLLSACRFFWRGGVLVICRFVDFKSIFLKFSGIVLFLTVKEWKTNMVRGFPQTLIYADLFWVIWFMRQCLGLCKHLFSKAQNIAI